MNRPQLLHRVTEAIKVALILLGLGLFLGLGIGSDRSMPRNAVVYLDHNSRQYIAPPCAEAREYARLLATSNASEAYLLRYAPEPECRDDGSFIQDDRSLTGSLLQKVGVLGPIRSRWNPDGAWNW